jgi:hypothetical protein
MLKRTLGLFKVSLWVTKTRPVLVVVKLAVTKNSWLYACGDQKFLITIGLVIKKICHQAYDDQKFLLPNLHLSKIFSYQL